MIEEFPPKETWALQCSLEELKDICYKGKGYGEYRQGLHFLLELYIETNKGEKQDIILALLISKT